MERVKIGIIGLGMAWDKLHYPAYQRLQDKFEISAVCDADPEKVKRAAQLLGLGKNHVYERYEALLMDQDIEAVDIMVPISENGDVAKAAIERKLHIIAEKPFAATAKAARELEKRIDKLKIKVLVAENFRYDEENKLIKKLLQEQAIGKPAFFIDNNISDFEKDREKDTFAAKEWRQYPDFPGGIFLDSAVHHIARMRFLFGEVTKVYALARPADVPYTPYSCINAMLSFHDEITGMYNYFCMGKETQAPLVGLRVFGTKGEIFLEERACGFVNLTLKDGPAQVIPYKPGEGYYGELLNFYNALRNNETIVSTPEKEIGDIEVIEKILSACEDRPK